MLVKGATDVKQKRAIQEMFQYWTPFRNYYQTQISQKYSLPNELDVTHAPRNHNIWVLELLWCANASWHSKYHQITVQAIETLIWSGNSCAVHQISMYLFFNWTWLDFRFSGESFIPRRIDINNFKTFYALKKIYKTSHLSIQTSKITRVYSFSGWILVPT